MYISRNIKVKINPSNFNHYKKYNNNIENKKTYFFDIEELTKTSSAEISVRCDNCGIKKTLKYKYYKKYNFSSGIYYCRKCNIKRKNQENYGVDYTFQRDDIKEKIKTTLNKKYGVDNISQVEEIKTKKQITYNNRTTEERKNINKKRENTLQENYGVNNISLVDSIKQQKKQTWDNKSNIDLLKIKNKRKDTLLNKYNVDHNLKIKSIKEQIKKTNMIKYDNENASKNEIIKNKIKKSLHKTLLSKQYKEIQDIITVNDSTFIISCNKCSNNFEITKILFYKRREYNTTICTKCNPIDSHISGKENKLLDFIKENYSGNIITSDRKILNGKELDIYIPKLNLAFEFNGIYWHNELYKDKDYHYNKTKICRKKKIQLIHIYEDDWNNRQEIIKSIILNKLEKTKHKIYARKTIIKELSSKESSIFYNNNHLQGKSGYSINIGLYYKDKLVSVMSFKKSKENYELVRFANKLYTNIVGGASKLLKYFIKTYKTKTITTFSNNDYSYGNLYENLNFKEVNIIKPDYSYIINGERKHKFNFRKKHLKQMGFNINNKTEHEICLENNIFRIYDSGKVKWELII